MHLCSLALLSPAPDLLPVVMQGRDSFEANWMYQHMKIATPLQLPLPLFSLFHFCCWYISPLLLFFLSIASIRCNAEVVLQRRADLRSQNSEKIRTSRSYDAGLLHPQVLSGGMLSGSGPHCGRHCTNRCSSPPSYKTALLYSCYQSGPVLTHAMFESCQGISERVPIDTTQMLSKDVKKWNSMCT